MTVKEDITKLPKWAQRRIRFLEDSVDYWKRMVTGLNQEKSPVMWSIMSEAQNKLPENANVYFETKEGRIEFRLRDGILTAYHPGSDALGCVSNGGVNSIRIIILPK